MNIVKSIKSIWAGNAQLSALLPPERVLAARSNRPQVYPYAIITSIATSQLFRTNKANTDRELIQIAVYGENYNQVRDIGNLMTEVLRDARNVEDTEGTVIMIERTTGELEFNDGSVTSAIAQFTVDTTKPRRD